MPMRESAHHPLEGLMWRMVTFDPDRFDASTNAGAVGLQGDGPSFPRSTSPIPATRKVQLKASTWNSLSPESGGTALQTADLVRDSRVDTRPTGAEHPPLCEPTTAAVRLRVSLLIGLGR